jgi:g-D-glutamyl-meso-diaminopimelate peptidase
MHFMEEYADRIPESATLCVVPMVNPDGVDMVLSGEKNTDWKANARGVDLNANYPAGWELAKESKKALGFDKPGPRGYMGPYPLSEPESRALANLTRRERFDVTLSLHTQGEEIYWRYGDHTPPGSLELAKALTYVSGYALENAPVESAHAGYKDWFIQEFNKPGFTVECGLGENPLPVESLDEIYPKVEAILRLVVFQQFQHDF